MVEPHRRHCVVSLSKTHLSLLSTCSTQEHLSRPNCKIVDWDAKNQNKQTNHCNFPGETNNGEVQADIKDKQTN